MGDVSFCITMDVEDRPGWRLKKPQHLIVLLCKGERQKEAMARDVWKKTENEGNLVFQEERLVNSIECC